MSHVSFGPISKFNTGRSYSKDGQPIYFANFTYQHEGLTLEGIVYHDRARGITRTIPAVGKAGGETHLYGESVPFFPFLSPSAEPWEWVRTFEASSAYWTLPGGYGYGLLLDFTKYLYDSKEA